MICRIKHIPSGLYYQPHRYGGSHLSKSGKIYHSEGNAQRTLKGISEIYVKENSVVHRITKDIISYTRASYAREQLVCPTTTKDWIIEKYDLDIL